MTRTRAGGDDHARRTGRSNATTRGRPLRHHQGGHIRLPDKLKVQEIALIDNPPHELRVSGNPPRAD